MTLKEPIVEGAYYLREDGVVIGPMTRNRATVHYFRGDTKGLTRRVWITHTDPAEVVAELERRAKRAYDRRENYVLSEAADLVAEKLVGET